MPVGCLVGFTLFARCVTLLCGLPGRDRWSLLGASVPGRVVSQVATTRLVADGVSLPYPSVGEGRSIGGQCLPGKATAKGRKPGFYEATMGKTQGEIRDKRQG